MTDSSSTTRKRITSEETQKALDFLVEAMGDDRVTPMAAICPSATGLLVEMLSITSSRASYTLDLLVKAGAITRIDKSHKVLVNRATVRLDTPPALSDSDKDRYEEAIRRLSTLLEEERGRTSQLTTEVEGLKTKLNELTKTDGPSSDVLEIMAGIGVA